MAASATTSCFPRSWTRRERAAIRARRIPGLARSRERAGAGALACAGGWGVLRHLAGRPAWPVAVHQARACQAEGLRGLAGAGVAQRVRVGMDAVRSGARARQRAASA